MSKGFDRTRLGVISRLHQVRDEVVNTFTDLLEFPELDPSMCADWPSDTKYYHPIIPSWRDGTIFQRNEHMYVQHADHVPKPDWVRPGQIIYGFTVYDNVIDNFVQRMDKWLARLKFLQPHALVMPDYSTFVSDPGIVQAYWYFQNLSLACEFQKRGFKVIPNSCTTGPMSYWFAFCGIPKGIPAMFINLRTALDKSVVSRFNVGMQANTIREIVRRLEPERLIILGPKKPQMRMQLAQAAGGVPVSFLHRTQKVFEEGAL